MAGWATSTSPRRLVRAASSPTKVPRWLQAAAPSSVAVRPRTAEGKVAHPRRTYNLEIKHFEICDATLMTHERRPVFACCIWCTRGSTPSRETSLPSLPTSLTVNCELLTTELQWHFSAPLNQRSPQSPRSATGAPNATCEHWPSFVRHQSGVTNLEVLISKL